TINNNKNVDDLLKEEQATKKRQLKIIDYAKVILNDHANSVWPNFYETPEEPAKRTLDDINDTEWIGYGKLSMSSYDTAWMAMIPSEKYKSTNLPKDFELAFPQCLKWFFYHQDDNGSWAGKDVKGVLPCLADLLVLGLFRSRSGDYLEEKLNDLGLTLSQFNSNYVGFELIVPYMLNELENLKPSVVFQFPDEQRLIKEHARKMNLIPIEALFALAAKRQPVAMIHLIEAFGNKIDFTKIQNEDFQAINGSYGSSAAATASVLINSPNWDSKAYKFLQKIIAKAPADGTSLGYVPTISDVDNKSIQSLLEKIKITAEFISHVVSLQKGAVRWTSWDNRIPADVDTTVTCHWIIDQILPEIECYLKKLGATFYNGRNFVTYPGERTVSISSNVHALRLLLAKYSKDKYRNNEDNYIITMQTKTEAGKKITIQQVISTIIELIMANRNEAMNDDEFFYQKQPLLWIGKQLYSVPN
ncbi:4450_t:CDS:2, partial [Entrophospora sp. SA101]